jgi:CheY-like chemotaxis protein
MNKFFLLADDDQDDAELFAEALSTVDSSVYFHRVENGLAVFDYLKNTGSKKPDLIFLDLNMPLMTGWQCLSKLKNDLHLKDIPVIMYSTSSYQHDKDVALQLGATGFITKPTEYQLLKKILADIARNVDADLQKALQEIRR